MNVHLRSLPSRSKAKQFPWWHLTSFDSLSLFGSFDHQRVLQAFLDSIGYDSFGNLPTNGTCALLTAIFRLSRRVSERVVIYVRHCGIVRRYSFNFWRANIKKPSQHLPVWYWYTCTLQKALPTPGAPAAAAPSSARPGSGPSQTPHRGARLDYLGITIRIPETNSYFTPENGWLEYDPFLLGFGTFSGANR